MNNQETLIKAIKQQAALFLLDAREFYPFGTYINNNNKIVPFSAYIEDEHDRPKSKPLIDILERGIRTRLDNGECIIGALAFDILLTEDHQKFDGMLVRIFENDEILEKTFKYYIHENYVEFI